ncbi:ESF1 homolog [Clupea harengus]|uniref:ESF1 homolog n=1 Tax=Clupea harengus TaxID=7950 RepID=A0A6P3VYI6_CLUHA|nr:ESF1 homolog [Clupea harengus]
MASEKNQGGDDDRFLKVKKDPRFWEMPDKERKIKIDKRFQSMFHDDRFKLKYTVDKRGRPVNHTSSEDLKRFYKLSDSDFSDTELEKQEGKKKKEKKKKKASKAELEEIQDEEAEEEEDKDVKTLKKDKKTSKPKDTPLLKTVQPTRGVKVYEEGEEEEEEPSEKGEEDDDSGDDDMEGGVSEDSVQEGEGEEDDEEEDDEEEDEDDDEDTGSESEVESDGDSGPDLARGKGNVETSSDEDEDDVEDILRREGEEIVHDWGEMWKDAPRADELSRRLAVCNMNWDRMKAKDLLALFNSFKPKDGVILSVKIYPSEFGKERIHAEQTQGPLELTALPEDFDDDADTEEKKLYRERIRDYQFKRLRYYYALVECDTVTTATKVYEECDGFEYESSCSTLDLRFVPDDMIFEDEPTDEAVDVDLASYQPKIFSSTATTTAKVELTWDETDHDRVTAFSRNFNKDELLDMDFKTYLASSSEEEEEEVEVEEEQTEEVPEAPEPVVESREATPRESRKKRSKEDQILKYRELLQGIQQKERDKEREHDMEMEITWVPGLKEKTEKLVKKKMEVKEQLTPWEEYLQKKKDKKIEKRKAKQEAAEAEISDDELPADVDFNDPFFSEELGTSAPKGKGKGKKNRKEEEEKTPEEEEEIERRKAEMALLMDDDEDEKHKHFNFDKIVEEQNLSKKKRKKLLKSNTPLEEDNFQMDLKDPRFDAMFTSHLYNLDPSEPGYKKTKATQSFLDEKQRRREEKQQKQEQEMTKKKQEVADESVPTTSSSTSKRKETDPNLSLLIKNIKNKTEQFQARKKQKM